MIEGGSTGADVVNALGSAWTTAGLYADVAHREPFHAAVAKIARWRGPDLQVRSGGFVVSGEPLAGPEAAGRLANALFLHGAESVGFSEVLTPEALAHLFRLVGLAPEVVDAEGGLASMVAGSRLPGIRLSMRAQLAPGGGETREVVDGAHPAGPEEDLPLEHSFFERLESVAAHPDADERTAAVMGLVDGFADLDPSVQADLIDQLLGGVRADLRDLFLDQLAPNDLARVVEHLDPTAFRVLGEYVSYVDGPRRTELAEAIGDPSSVLKFRARVAESVRDRMEGIRLTRPTEPAKGLEARPDEWFDASVEVLGGLALVEDKEDRLEKLAETWKTRVSVSLAGHEDDKALAWYRAIIDLDDPPEPLAEAAKGIPDHDEIRGLVGRRSNGGAVSTREFVDLLMDRDPARVIGPIADAGDDGDGLAAMAATDPDALLAALESVEDPLPIVVALKTAGYRGTDPRLIALLDDPSTHGRSEVLVLLGPSLGVERLGHLLDDADQGVRRQAAELLRRGRTPAGAQLLFKRFEADGVDDDEREMLAHLLAATTDGARLLEDVAGRTALLLSGSGRRLRHAARAALEARGGRA